MAGTYKMGECLHLHLQRVQVPAHFRQKVRVRLVCTQYELRYTHRYTVIAKYCVQESHKDSRRCDTRTVRLAQHSLTQLSGLRL